MNVKKKILINCKICSKELFVTKRKIERGKKYCSISCQIKARTTRQTTLCKVCKKKFIIHQFKIKTGRGKFCSAKCMGVWMSSNLVGENALRWSGINASYAAIHQWLNNKFGKASSCENKNCVSVKPSKYEWALIKGERYERKRENFMQLCPSCHRKYDYKKCMGKHISKMLKRYFTKNQSHRTGIKHTAEVKRRMKLSHKLNCRCKPHMMYRARFLQNQLI